MQAVRTLGRFTFISLLVAACGGGGSGSQPDAFQLPPDGGTTGGTAKAFDPCTPNSTDPSMKCASSTDDCLADPADSTGQTFTCLPKCSTNNDCDIQYFCVPNGGGTGGATFGPIADHCYIAYCGQLANPIVTNGTTGGNCTVGGQTGLTDIPGFCYPLKDGSYGICVDSGTETAGQTCDPNATRGQASMICDQSSQCIGQPPSFTTHVCETNCDPTKILAGDPTGGCTAANLDCLDLSSMYTVTNGTQKTVLNSTVGVCQNIIACDVTKTGQCTAADTASNKAGCVFTNAVRSTGACDPGGNGSLAAGATCDPSKVGMGDATECAEGTYCFQAAGSSTASCTPYCSLASGAPACATGTCTAITISAGFDQQTGTADDQVTETWGLCL